MARIFLIVFGLSLSLITLPCLSAEPEPEPKTGSATKTEPETKPATPTATPAVKPNRSYLPSQEVKQITIDNQPFELLVRPWEGKQKRGASIILPATNGTADAPGLMAFVRRNINPAGWASLSLTPPTEPPAPNFATAAEEVASPGAAQLSTPSNKPSPKTLPENSRKHLLEQEDFLVKSLSQLETVGADYPGKRVLITADQSAELLISLLSQKKIANPDVLIVINPYSENEERNQALAEKLAKLTMPILDIQSPDGHPASLSTAEQRRTLAVTLETPNYRQSQLLLNLDNESAWQNCLNTIKGFAARMSTGY